MCGRLIVIFSLGNHITFSTPDGLEATGRIEGYFRDGGQEGPILAEVRPLHPPQHYDQAQQRKLRGFQVRQGDLIADRGQMIILPSSFLVKVEIRAVRFVSHLPVLCVVQFCEILMTLPFQQHSLDRQTG